MLILYELYFKHKIATRYYIIHSNNELILDPIKTGVTPFRRIGLK